MSRLITKFRQTVLSAGLAMIAAPAALALDALPQPLDKALSEAEARQNFKVSYTMTWQWEEAADVVERYDARTGEWTLVSGDPGALDRTGRKKLNTYKRVESEPGGLLYADYRDSLKGVTLDQETSDAWLYNFIAGQAESADLEDGAEEKVTTQIRVSKEDGAMELYAVKALTPFKPNAVSKLETFIFEQNFERITPDTPPVMTRVYWKAVGKQLLSSVDEEYTVLFSDFEIVE